MIFFYHSQFVAAVMDASLYKNSSLHLMIPNYGLFLDCFLEVQAPKRKKWINKYLWDRVGWVSQFSR